jgi:Peptidase_C39 like family
MLGLVGLLVGASIWLGVSDERMLSVPYRSQLDGSAYARANCGPTALSMVLAYYGIDASLWDLRVRSMQAQHSWVDDDGGYSDRYGVFVYNLASAGESFGMRADGLWLREGNHVDRLRAWQAGDLRKEIDSGRPVIVQVLYRELPGNARSRYYDDHYIVVHGLIGRDFVYSDPLDGPEQLISEVDLLRAMNDSSSPLTGFALVKAN